MRGKCIPPIIYRTLLFLTIYLADSMASRFLLWLQITTAFFLFTHLINKEQPSIVRIAEKMMYAPKTLILALKIVKFSERKKNCIAEKKSIVRIAEKKMYAPKTLILALTDVKFSQRKKIALQKKSQSFALQKKDVCSKNAYFGFENRKIFSAAGAKPPHPFAVFVSAIQNTLPLQNPGYTTGY